MTALTLSRTVSQGRNRSIEASLHPAHDGGKFRCWLGALLSSPGDQAEAWQLVGQIDVEPDQTAVSHALFKNCARQKPDHSGVRDEVQRREPRRGLHP